MAKKLTTGRDEFDDFDDLGAFDDFEDDTSYKKSGKPAQPIREGAKKAVREKLMNASSLRSMVKKALPEQYGEVIDDYSAIPDGAREIVDDVKKQLRGPTHEFARALKNKLPSKFGRTRALLDKVVDNTQADPTYRRDVEGERNSEIADQLRDVFEESLASKDRAERARASEAQALQDEKDLLDMRFQHKMLKVMNVIARSTSISSQASTGYQLAASKKSLQLQYKQTFLLGDILSTLGSSAKMNEALLNRIVQNTSLPDVQKSNTLRAMKGSLRDKFNNSILDSFSGGGGGLIGGMLKNGKDAAGMSASMLGMTLSGLAQGMESDDLDFDDEHLSPEEKSRKQIASSIVGMILESGGPMAMKKGFGALRKRSKTVDKLATRGHDKATYFMNNQDNILRDKLAVKGDEHFAVGILKEIAEALMPQRKGMDRNLAMHSGRNLMAATSFDNMSKRSITEVIPGFLSRILQELQITRTGQMQPEYRFDYKTGTFKTTQGLTKSLLADMRVSSAVKDSMGNVTGEMKASGVEFSDEEAEKVQRAILSRRMNDEELDHKQLISDSMWTSAGFSPEQAKSIGDRFRQHFGQKDQFWTNNPEADKKLASMFTHIAEAGRSARGADPRAMIQEAFNQGHGDLMRKAGWVDDKGRISNDKIMSAIMGHEGGKVLDDIKEKPPEMSMAEWVKTMPERTAKALKDKAAKKAKANQKPELELDDYQTPQSIAAAGVGLHGPSQVIKREFNKTTNQTNNSRTVNVSAGSELKETLVDIREILKQGFIDLKEGIQVSLKPLKEKMSPLPVFNIDADQTMEYLRSKLDPESFKNLKDAIQDRAKTAAEGAKDMAKEGVEKSKRWYELNAEEIKDKGLKFSKEAAVKGKEALGKGKELGKEGIEKLMMARLRAKAKIRSLSAFGASGISADGLPDFADIYIEGSMVARVIGEKIREGAYQTADGVILRSVSEIAKHAGDIYDNTSDPVKIVMTVQEKTTAYTAATFKTFNQKFGEFAAAAFAKAKKDIISIAGGARRGIKSLKSLLNNTVVAYGKELIIPPKDVYVKGESTPRLYAWKMRAGLYTNQVGGSVIEWPAQIKGPVIEMVNGEPQVILSGEDFTKGIHDVNGKPFEMLAVRMAKATSAGLARVREGFGALASKAGSAVSWGADKTKQGIKGVGTFATSGLNGVMYGEGIPGGGGAGVGGEGISLLQEIRDILDERLGASGFGGGKRRGKGGKSSKSQKSTTNTNQETKDQTPEVFTPGATQAAHTPQSQEGLRANTNTQSNGLGGLIGGFASMGKGAMDVFSRTKQALARRKGGKAGALGELMGPRPELVGPVQPQGIADANAAATAAAAAAAPAAAKKKGGFLAGLLSALGGGGSAAQIAQGVAGANGKAKNTTGGQAAEGPKYNSAQDRINRATNKNAENLKTHADFKGPDNNDGHKNTIDSLLEMLSGKGAAISGAIGDAADWLFDRDGKKGGKAGKAGKAAKASRTSRLASWFGKKTVGAGRAVGNALSGAPGRIANAGKYMRLGGLGASLLGRGAWKAGGAVVGAIAAVLGAPVIGTALTVAGTVWTMYEIYKWLEGDNTKKRLTALRMMEYGFGKDDQEHRKRVAQIEGMLRPAMKMEGDKISFDDKKVDLQALLKVTGVNEKDEKRVALFAEWMDNRFKPVLAKWSNAAQAVKSTFEKIDELPASVQKQILNTTGADTTGWDVTASPFNTDPIGLKREDIQRAYTNLSQALDEEAKKEPKKDEVDKEGAKSKSMQAKEQMDALMKPGGLKAGMDASDALAKRQEEIRKQMTGTRGGGSAVALSTLAIKKIPSGTLDALGAIRMYTYGLTDITREKLKTISDLEGATQEYVSVQKNGKADAKVDFEALFEKVQGNFGISTSDTERKDSLRTWFEKRFLPTYTTFYAQLMFHTGASTIEAALDSIKPSAALAVANAVIATEVWDQHASPWGTSYPVGTSPAICLESLRLLQERAEREKVEIEKSTSRKEEKGSTGSAVPQAEPESSSAGMQKTSYQPSSSGSSSSAPSGASYQPGAPSYEDRKNTGGSGQTIGAGSAYAGSVAATTDRASNDNSYTEGGSKASPASEKKMAALAAGAKDIKELVGATAKEVGVDPEIAKVTVAMESAFRPNAKAPTSSASGLYQFINDTWKLTTNKHGRKYGITPDTSRFDPKASAIMGAHFLKDNMQMAKSMGIPQNAVGMYTMHFMGPNGARAFWRLKDNDLPAQAFPAQAKANKTIFYHPNGQPRTRAQIAELFAQKINKAAKNYGISIDTNAGAKPASSGNDSAAAPGAGAESSAAADSSGASTPASGDGMQNAVYRPKQEAARPERQAAAQTVGSRYSESTTGSGDAVVSMPQSRPARAEAERASTDKAHMSSMEALAQRADTHISVSREQLDVLKEIRDILKGKAEEKPEGSAAPSKAESPTVNAPAGGTQPRPPRSSVMSQRMAA